MTIQCKNLDNRSMTRRKRGNWNLGQNGNDVLIYDRAGQIRIALGRMGGEEVFTKVMEKRCPTDME